MKRSILQITFFCLVAVSFTSCISTNRAYQSSPVRSRIVQLDPIRADIKVDENVKIKGESNATYLFAIRISGDRTFADGINYSGDGDISTMAKLNPLKALNGMRLSKVRAAAAYKALDGKGFDFIVHPTYSTTIESYVVFKKYKVKVEGYGANYENFRTEKQKVVITNNQQEYVFPEPAK